MKRKILVIDDSKSVRQQVGLVLTEAGFTVIEAVDGQDGAEKLNATPDLSLVICDMNMPRMNGIELIAYAMGRPESRTLPILVLTTEGEPQLMAKAKSLGAKAWMIKPFKPELLLATANKIAKVA